MQLMSASCRRTVSTEHHPADVTADRSFFNCTTTLLLSAAVRLPVVHYCCSYYFHDTHLDSHRGAILFDHRVGTYGRRPFAHPFPKSAPPGTIGAWWRRCSDCSRTFNVLDLGSGMDCPKTLFRRRHFQVSGADLNPSSSSSHIAILSSNCTFDTIVVLVVMFITLVTLKITELNWTELNYRGVKKCKIWHRFSTTVVFDTLWFRWRICLWYNHVRECADRRRLFKAADSCQPRGRKRPAKSLYAELSLEDNDLSLPVRWDALWDLIVGWPVYCPPSTVSRPAVWWRRWFTARHGELLSNPTCHNLRTLGYGLSVNIVTCTAQKTFINKRTLSHCNDFCSCSFSFYCVFIIMYFCLICIVLSYHTFNVVVLWRINK